MATKKIITEKRAVFFLKNKGGTGNSLVSRLVWERLRASAPAARAYDLDGTTGSLAQFYGVYDADGTLVTPQPAEGVTPIFLHGDNPDEMLAMLDDGADLILADFPATALTVLQKLEAQMSVLAEFGRRGYAITIVSVVTPYLASLENVKMAMTLAPTAQHVVVLNEGFGEPDDFFLWTGDAAQNEPEAEGRKTLLGSGGIEITLPAVKARPLVLVDALNLPFRDALEHPRMKTAQRLRLRRWMDDAYDAMSPAAHVLGFPTSAVAAPTSEAVS